MIKDIMSKNIVVASIYNNINEIANLMKEYNIGFIPIQKEKKIVGVVTDRDIVIKSVSNNDTKIKCNMNKISIDQNESIDTALKLMRDNKIKRLLVVDQEKLVGILSISDIINHSDSKEILETLKVIYTIKDTDKLPVSEIDDFYL